MAPSSSLTERAATPPLESGDRLTRPEFERRYAAMPEGLKAELIDGTVYMASPVRSDQHGEPHFRLVGVLFGYIAATPGVHGGDNITLRLDFDNEPQPDVVLRIDESRGGQATVDDEGFVVGAPEFVAEIAASTASQDVGRKLDVYRRHGVQEYLVWRVLDGAMDWFVLNHGRYDRLPPDAQGIVQSRALPGLWLDLPALAAGDLARVLKTLQDGLASPEHQEFVARLQARP